MPAATQNRDKTSECQEDLRPIGLKTPIEERTKDWCQLRDDKEENKDKKLFLLQALL
jgi:hypothetical protein